MRRRLAVLGVAALLVAGCSGGGATRTVTAPSSSSTVPGAGSPAALVIQRFFEAAVAHDEATARSLLSAEALRFQDSVSTPWWSPNTVSVTHLRVFSVRPSPGGYPSDQSDYTDITQVTVDLDVVFSDDGLMGMSNGSTTIFSYVGRRVDGDSWRILSLGGGP